VERWVRAIYAAAHSADAAAPPEHSPGLLARRPDSERFSGDTSPQAGGAGADPGIGGAGGAEAPTPPSAGRLAGGRSSQRAAENIERALLKVAPPPPLPTVAPTYVPTVHSLC